MKWTVYKVAPSVQCLDLVPVRMESELQIKEHLPLGSLTLA